MWETKEEERMRIKIPVMAIGDFGMAEGWEQEMALASQGTEVNVTLPSKGPESIECIYDVAM